MLTRRRFLPVALLVLLTATGCASVQPLSPDRAGRTGHYIDTSVFEIPRLLSPPPANDSAETRAELDEMLRIQASRSPAAAERSVKDAGVSVFRFADVIGPRFTEQKLPVVKAFFARLLEDEGLIVGPAKDAFDRPRPFVLEPRLQPLIDRPKSSAYPSGHSTWGYTMGLVLAQMLPEKRNEIMARAKEYAHNRVVVGVHYPSDVAAGEHAASAFVAMLFLSPRFRADLAAATAELRASGTDMASPR